MQITLLYQKYRIETLCLEKRACYIQSGNKEQSMPSILSIIEPISADVDQKFDIKLRSHVTERLVGTLVCIDSECINLSLLRYYSFRKQNCTRHAYSEGGRWIYSLPTQRKMSQYRPFALQMTTKRSRTTKNTPLPDAYPLPRPLNEIS